MKETHEWIRIFAIVQHRVNNHLRNCVHTSLFCIYYEMRVYKKENCLTKKLILIWKLHNVRTTRDYSLHWYFERAEGIGVNITFAACTFFGSVFVFHMNRVDMSAVESVGDCVHPVSFKYTKWTSTEYRDGSLLDSGFMITTGLLDILKMAFTFLGLKLVFIYLTLYITMYCVLTCKETIFIR